MASCKSKERHRGDESGSGGVEDCQRLIEEPARSELKKKAFSERKPL
jgi:hypothetical protein